MVYLGMINGRYFFTEIKRVLCSPVIWIIMLVEFIFSLIPIYDCSLCLGFKYAKESSYSVELITNGFAWSLLVIITPLIICYPYSLSYSTECNCGYGNILILKLSKKCYMTTKYLLNFILSGLITTIPFLLMEILVVSICGLSTPNKYVMCYPISFYPQVAQRHPIAYLAILTINVFVLSGIIGTLGIGVANVCKKRIVAYVIPLCVFVLSGMVMGIFCQSIDLYTCYILPERKSQNVLVLLLTYAFYFGVGTVLYWFGDKSEEFDS